MIRRALTWLERSLAYFPEWTFKGTPEHVGLPYENLWLETDLGNTIHGWWMPGPAVRPAPADGRPTWVYLHGSGGNISGRLDGYRAIHQRFGANILAIDYSGFGRNHGTPSEDDTYADAHAAVVEAIRRHHAQDASPGPLVYMGVSMGAAVAARVAVDKKPDALLLESPPTSFPELAPIQYPWTRMLPLSKLLRFRYETTHHLSSLNVPTLVIHGDEDEIVPIRYARSVFASANDPKEMYIVRGGTHDRPDLVDPDSYYDVMQRFIEKHRSQSRNSVGEHLAAD
jgi:pimeloyl-ACP methyl ester carboxylesterase